MFDFLMDLLAIYGVFIIVRFIFRLIFGGKRKSEPPNRPQLKGLPWMGKEARDAWEAQQEYDRYYERGLYNEWAKKHKKPRDPWADL